MLLRLEGITRSFGGRDLFRDVTLGLYRDDRVGLVGPNGAGKTTLLRIAAGDDVPDTGGVVVPRNVRVGLLRQEIDPDRDTSVFDEVSSALAHLDDLERELASLEAEMERVGGDGGEVPADLAARYDRGRAAFELGGGFERAARVERVLSGLGFDAESVARPLRSFSGGWLMRVELAKLLLSAPDVLLLDEPTNHLDLPSIQWFEETLAAYPGAAIIISHDRTFLRRHATRVAELAAGRFTIFDGSYDRYVVHREQRRAHLLAQRASQERRIAETERFIERFRYKASKARQVQSRVKALEKLERVEVESARSASLGLRIPEPVRSGDAVLRLEEVHKSYGAHAVYRGIDLLIRRGDRVALVGPNGAGKSTLLRIAAGALPIDAGERSVGHNVEVAFYAQHQLEVLEPGRSALDELASAATTEDVPRLRGHLGAFLFSGDDVEKLVGVLSGGEKARLALAKMLLRPANFLILDEPTNHLDVDACEVLEAALSRYAGTLLLISHDRAFINALATRVIDVSGGALHEHLGNYDDYLRAQRAGPAAPLSPSAGSAAPAGAGAEAGAKRERIAERERAKQQARRLGRARKRIAVLEEEIADLEDRLERLTWKAADPEVFRDGDAARGVEAERAEIRAAIDGRYGEWERLATEVEAQESGDA
jgi:ATP-binding cassette subfamily F protein 3